MALANQYSTAVGYICYTGAVSKYFDKFIAIALHNAHTTTTTWSDALSKVNTYASTNAITVGSTTYNSNALGTTSACDQVANNSGTSSKTRSGNLVKGWRLPSVTDWRYILEGFGGPSASSPAGVGAGNTQPYGNGETLQNAINSACGNTELKNNDEYWMSSELSSNTTSAWYYGFAGWFGAPEKSYNINVRAVFAY